MLQTVCFPIENVVLGIQQLRKMYTEIIENGCQGKLCNQIGKLYLNDGKMGATIDTKLKQKLKKAWRN